MSADTLTETNEKQYLSLPELERDGIRHFFTIRKNNAYKNPPPLNPLPQGEGRYEVQSRGDGQGDPQNSLPFKGRVRVGMGFATDNLILAKQVHGDDILIIDKPVDDVKKLKEYATAKQCDAIITNQRNVGIGVVSADCLPALLYDPVHSVIAAVHAGWRGTLKGIMSKVVCQMMDMFDCRPEDIVAGIGPVIGECCYEVGDIVAKPINESNPAWGSFLKPLENGRSILNLTGLNSFQIEAVGVQRTNIFNLGLCTSCNKDLFPSYRRDGIGTGRIISGIEMKSEQ
ncbi:MAG: peptidoglycan editing factor PgeF [Nitrospirae bacterium]|nr:peptidoglycan editing factor PgeF [Nitrospirota bacterium]